MNFLETRRIVYNRIGKLEPENVSEIMGYLLLQDNSEQHMVYLSRCSDMVLQGTIHQAKHDLIHNKWMSTLISSPLQSPFPSPSPSPSTSSAVPWQYLHWEPQVVPRTTGSVYFDYGLVNGGQSSSDYPVRTCYYFNRGFCRHGNNCRYLHGQSSDSHRPFSGNHSVEGNSSNSNEDQLFTPASLKRLEFEIAQLLSFRGGHPVSIASLPMLYCAEYGKVLQAEGYLTESQRHGKAGYSLTKLLARLKHRIRVIDRPHGQHAVVLIEDAPKYMENRIHRNDPGPIVHGSRQLYLTFPAASTFTEDDVADHFNTFGQVEDVRIPCQLKRMFGFVTFASSDTVKMILSKGNQHLVGGARVLVKPYREKPKFVESKHQNERIEVPTYCSPPQFINMNSGFPSTPRGFDPSEFFRTQQLIEHQRQAQAQAYELERKHMEELQLANQPDYSYFGYPLDVSNGSEDQQDLPLEERFNHVVHILDSDDDTNFTDWESINRLDLPEN